jgi:hypothetical protein
MKLIGIKEHFLAFHSGTIEGRLSYPQDWG